jgi:hypothetical protein
MLLCGIAALYAAYAPAPAAQAGTYQIVNDTSKGIDSWDFRGTAGFVGCSIFSYPGICNNADVTRPTPLRVFAYGKAAADAEAYWWWVAPPTVSIVSGAVTVNHTTTARSRVFMKARLRASAFGSQPQLHTADGDARRTWGIPAGSEAVGVYLKAIVGHDFTNKWSNSIAVESMTATLRDDTAPLGSVSGPLAAGNWLNQSQPVCLSAAATDAGSGVATSQLRDQVGTVLTSHAVTVEPVRQPGKTSYAHDLCVTPGSLADGDHAMSVRIGDAAGETTDIPLTVKVDTHAPTAVSLQPATGTVDRRPQVSFSVDGGPSGVARFQASLDGMPMTIAGDSATLQPVTDLAFGPHTVTWSAADKAGNARDGAWVFDVVDASPPSLSDAAPAAGSSSEQRRPAIGFRLTDGESGIDPSTLHVQLDGAEIAPFASYVDGTFSYLPTSDLAYGRHLVRVAVSDRWGNALAPTQWEFTVADSTAPVLGDVRPHDGLAGADRTPEISVGIADVGGKGVDPKTISVTLDGDDVSAKGTFANGRFTLAVANPLPFGRHVVQAGAADLAGNHSAILTWSFDVRDETPPVIDGRTPMPGATVTGAAAISFDVADAGTGIDSASLSVMVDASDVTSWGTFAGGHFHYAPGNLGPGVHTISVTVADTSGNAVGPLMWQFAVANPATLALKAVSAPTGLVAGKSGSLRFAVLSSGTPLADARVQLLARVAGQAGFSPVGMATSDASGEVAWRISPSHTTTYRIELADDGSVAVERAVAVSRRVTLSAASKRVRAGGTIRLSGRVQPAAPGRQISVQMLTSRGWVTVAKPRLSRASTFGRTFVPRVSGRYLFRAVAAATKANTAGVSRTVTVRDR